MRAIRPVIWIAVNYLEIDIRSDTLANERQQPNGSCVDWQELRFMQIHANGESGVSIKRVSTNGKAPCGKSFMKSWMNGAIVRNEWLNEIGAKGGCVSKGANVRIVWIHTWRWSRIDWVHVQAVTKRPTNNGVSLRPPAESLANVSTRIEYINGWSTSKSKTMGMHLGVMSSSAKHGLNEMALQAESPFDLLDDLRQAPEYRTSEAEVGASFENDNDAFWLKTLPT